MNIKQLQINTILERIKKIQYPGKICIKNILNDVLGFDCSDYDRIDHVLFDCRCFGVKFKTKEILSIGISYVVYIPMEDFES